MLSAAAFTRPEQLPLNIDMAGVHRDAAYREFQVLTRAMESEPRVQPAGLDVTPSELSELQGCFRYFHWTRLLGLPEPGTKASEGAPQLRLGSIAHEILEAGGSPSLDALRLQGVPDLHEVFASKEWQSLEEGEVDRELPFILHVRAAGRDCYVRGRMDAVVPGTPPRVIDYKYASWRTGVEADYEIQMTAYSLALMKSAGLDRAVAELWYLRTPMKVIRQEYSRQQAEQRLADLLGRYLEAMATGEWPLAERTYCDRIQCGFRDRCWAGPTGSIS
jgi:hypothetical protein